jgi:hypothetical protein
MPSDGFFQVRCCICTYYQHHAGTYCSCCPRGHVIFLSSMYCAGVRGREWAGRRNAAEGGSICGFIIYFLNKIYLYKTIELSLFLYMYIHHGLP